MSTNVSSSHFRRKSNLVGEGAIRVKYGKKQNVIVTTFFGCNLVLLFGIEVAVAHHEECLKVVVLLGNTQPGVPDHISHLERGKLKIKTFSSYKSTTWGRKKKEQKRRRK